MPTSFSPEALKFLRGIARHNDRDWFLPRKPIFDRELRAPMLALIEEINHALATFAPTHRTPPHKAMMRIYRDTRFAADKRPYKTHIAAWWSPSAPSAHVPKTSAAGFYLSISAARVVVAAGCYMPTPDQLLAIRRHLLTHHAELRRILASRKLRAAFDLTAESPLEGRRLTRPPRGFSAADPAALPLILHQQWGLAATLPAERATLPTLLADITSRFALAAPFVHFLNTPILQNPAEFDPFPLNMSQKSHKPLKNPEKTEKTH